MTTNVNPILENLNEPQRKAVEHLKGPTLILAGAGSGKTKALTHRIANLMEHGVQPWQILAVTFTNKAAGEMKQRIKNILRITEEEGVNPFSFGSGKLPIMGTFHSICARILRRDIEHIGRDRSFVIYDSSDQQRLMKEVLREMSIDEKDLKPKSALGYIGRFKCEAILPKEAAEQATTAQMHQVTNVYAKYQSALRQANAMDFDDLILETVRLFREREDILDRYQETWQYLHVDEYQDTNHAQYLFISLLAKKYRNLCVIGDPDQSIYAFRGADIRNILEFKNEYTNAVHIKLEQNYRSTQTILDGAGSVIKINPNRPEKDMWTDKGFGNKIIVHEVSDERKEAQEAMVHIEKKRAEGMNLNDQAILYRTNAQSRLFEEACLKNGIPYRIIGGVKFYARREIKDVLAYLYLILNPNDTISLLRVINVPSRKIGLTTIAKLQEHASEHGLTLWDTLKEVQSIVSLNGPTRERLAMFVQLIQELQQYAKTAVVSQVGEHLLNKVNMELFVKDDTEEGDTRWQNILELVSVMKKYDQLDPNTSLTSFLEEVALISEVDKLQDVHDDALTLMTLHLCKGLEYGHIIVAGCEEGIFPHSNALFSKEQLEEECRLMYVGMTRAKKELTLTYTRTRSQWGDVQANAPSRYLSELPEELTERRSDEVLSAFAWASESGQQKAWTDHPVARTGFGGKLEPFRQESSVDDIEFNQDISFDDVSQDPFAQGTRVTHPSFGDGTVLAKRGDIVEVQFDAGSKKNLALSIAPLTII